MREQIMGTLHDEPAVRVAVVGLGPIGIEVAKALASQRGLVLVGACDVAPALVGRSLAEVAPGAPAVAIDGSLDAVFARGVDAIALCTSSSIRGIASDLV